MSEGSSIDVEGKSIFKHNVAVFNGGETNFKIRNNTACVLSLRMPKITYGYIFRKTIKDVLTVAHR